MYLHQPALWSYQALEYLTGVVYHSKAKQHWSSFAAACDTRHCRSSQGWRGEKLPETEERRSLYNIEKVQRGQQKKKKRMNHSTAPSHSTFKGNWG
jgi:hypothetical protein